MHFQISAIVLLAICGLAAAGHLYHHHGAGAQHSSSYAVVSKHEEPAVKHNGGGHEWARQGTSEGGHDAGHDAGHYEEYTHEESHDFHAHPKYEFDYAVKDEKTGDSKNHWETRDGDKVKGAYSIKEADGTTRIVEYTADHINGYNAIVKTVVHGHEEHEGHAHEEHESHGHESHDYGHH